MPEQKDNPFLKKETDKQPEFIRDPVNGSFDILLSADKLTASLSIKAPKYDGTPVTFEQVKEGIDANKIVVDIDEKVIRQTIDECAKNGADAKKVVFAHGIPPQKGTDGAIKYLFEMPKQRDVTPPEEMDSEATDEELKGSVDFKELNLIINVSKDQVIAEKIAPTEGIPGTTVTGETIRAPLSTSAELLPGQNVILTDDGKGFVSEIDGQVVIKGKYINVEPIYMVQNDVDYSTGNIHFKGTVKIGGTVLDGFKVEAGEDITVKKLVEGGTLIAGGNIVVEGGIIGNETSRIVAGKKIKTTFIENAHIEAKDDIVVAKVILNSHIQTSGRVLIEKGSIVGGSISATMGIFSRVIGSDYAVTKVQCGTDLELQKRLTKITADLGSAERNIDKITSAIGPLIKDTSLIARFPAEKQEMIKKLVIELKNQQIVISQLQEEKAKIEKEQSLIKTAVIVAYGDLKQLVRVTIGASSFENQKLAKGVQLWENRIKNAIEMGAARK